MRHFKTYLTILALLALGVTGCLVSGTYPIVEKINFPFTAGSTGFYWYPVDMTNNDDWDEHSDELDDIEAIGFEFDISNTTAQTCAFSVLIKAEKGEADPFNPPATVILSEYTLIIDDLEVAANSTRHLSYAESLGMIQNQATVKNIILSGRFDCIGTSCLYTGNGSFDVKNGKVIITVSASN